MPAKKTKSGFEYTVDENLADDWELFEDLSESSRYAEIRAAKRILGTEEQYNRLKEYCRDKNGRVSTKKMDAELANILEDMTSKN